MVSSLAPQKFHLFSAPHQLISLVAYIDLTTLNFIFLNIWSFQRFKRLVVTCGVGRFFVGVEMINYENEHGKNDGHCSSPYARSIWREAGSLKTIFCGFFADTI